MSVWKEPTSNASRSWVQGRVTSNGGGPQLRAHLRRAIAAEEVAQAKGRRHQRGLKPCSAHTAARIVAGDGGGHGWAPIVNRGARRRTERSCHVTSAGSCGSRGSNKKRGSRPTRLEASLSALAALYSLTTHTCGRVKTHPLYHIISYHILHVA